MTLFLILISLLIALIILIPLIKRFSSNINAERSRAIARWVLPLMALAMVLQLLVYYFK